jgi:uroporphyrinogen decarboxylase
MTPRERWLALFSGERPDRVPCDYWATPEVTARLLQELGCATQRQLWERLGIDKCIHLAPIHPRAKKDEWHIDSDFPVWHVGTEEVSYQGAGGNVAVYVETVIHPLAKAGTVADVENFAWPNPDDWDVRTMRVRCEEWKGYPILGGTYEPFYLYCHLRGLEQALQDLVLNPEIVEAALERLYSIHAAIIRRTLEEAADLIDFIYVAEDLGTQQSLLMSPVSFRRFLKPRMARMIELVHSYGVKVFHHDDGAIRPLLPDLIEIGIDLLNPIQWRCRGMEREGLARDFGASVVFHGGMDNQRTLPLGTSEDVRREVAENIAIFRNCKGYIVAPCHNIQPNTPTENILALYEAVQEFGARG